MKIQIEQPSLNNLLNTVKRAVGAKNSPHPILQCIKLGSYDGKELCAQSYNLELGIFTAVECHVDETGVIAVPFNLFSNLVSTLDASATVTLETDGMKLLVKAPTSNYTLQLAELEDFPDIDQGEPASGFTTLHHDFSETIKSAIYAASNEPSKQVLQGVRLSITDSSIFACATDGHRLAITGQDDPDATSVTIPAKALSEMLRLKGFEGNLNISTNGHAAYSAAGTVITSRLLDGKFPDVEKLIPPTFESNVILDRQELIAAISRIGILASFSFSAVKLAYTSGKFTVSHSADYGNGTENVQTHGASGQPFTLACNAGYILDALRAIPADQIVIQANTPHAPFTVTPHNSPALQTHLIMPVQTRE